MKGKGWVVWLLVVALICVIAVAGCGKSDPPEQVLKKMIAGTAADGKEGAKPYLTEDGMKQQHFGYETYDNVPALWQNLCSRCGGKVRAVPNYSHPQVSPSGKTVKYEVLLSDGKESAPLNTDCGHVYFTMVLKDGKWLVDQLATVQAS